MESGASRIPPHVLCSGQELRAWTGGDGDPTGDWFTALTGRVGLSPPQGTEWIAKSPEAVLDYARLQTCRSRDTSCLDLWAADERLEFEYVYVPAPTRVVGSDDPSCCREISRS